MNALWQKVQRASPFISHVLLTGGANTLMAVLGLGSGILSARLLGPDGRGGLAAIQLWAGLLAAIGVLGLPEALVYFSAREPDDAGRYTASAGVLVVLSTLLFMGAGYLAVPTLLPAQPPHIIGAARWYLLLVPISALVGVPTHALWGRGAFGLWNALRLLPSAGWLAVLGLAGMIGRAKPEFVSAGHLVSLAVLVPVSYLVVRRATGPWRVDRDAGGHLLRYGLVSWSGGIPHLIRLRLDQIFLAAFFHGQVLGLYAVALAWSSAVWPLLSGVANAVFPHVASQRTHDQQNRALAQGSRLGVTLAACLAGVLILLTPFGVPLLFGREFAASIPVAIVLVVSAALGGLTVVLVQGLRGLGHPGAMARAELVSLGIMALSLVVLAKPLGMMGAALASLIGAAAGVLVLLGQARRISALPVSILVWPSAADVRTWWRRVRAPDEALTMPPLP